MEKRGVRNFGRARRARRVRGAREETGFQSRVQQPRSDRAQDFISTVRVRGGVGVDREHHDAAHADSETYFKLSRKEGVGVKVVGCGLSR